MKSNQEIRDWLRKAYYTTVFKQYINNMIQEQTLGEQRVRTNFNTLGSSAVDSIKHKTADLINITEGLPRDPDGEVERLINLANVAYETAAMWAVKAATYGK